MTVCRAGRYAAATNLSPESQNAISDVRCRRNDVSTRFRAVRRQRFTKM